MARRWEDSLELKWEEELSSEHKWEEARLEGKCRAGSSEQAECKLGLEWRQVDSGVLLLYNSHRGRIRSSSSEFNYILSDITGLSSESPSGCPVFRVLSAPPPPHSPVALFE